MFAHTLCTPHNFFYPFITYWSRSIISVSMSPAPVNKCNLVGLTVRFCHCHTLVASASTWRQISPSDERAHQHSKASVVISNSILLQRLLTYERWVWFTEVQVGLGSLVLIAAQGDRDGGWTISAPWNKSDGGIMSCCSTCFLTLNRTELNWSYITGEGPYSRK